MNPRRILLPGWKRDAIRKGATQLRVVMKPQPRLERDMLPTEPDSVGMVLVVDKGPGVSHHCGSLSFIRDYCPFQVGLKLWVPETWQHEDTCCDDHRCGQPTHIYYKATEVAPETFARWRPASQMSEWASRILIQVTEPARVQQLQEISEQDCGTEKPGWPNESWQYGKLIERTYRPRFACVWDSTHPNPEEKWAANPWVWPVTFEVLEGLT